MGIPTRSLRLTLFRMDFLRKSLSFRTDKARALLGFEPAIPFDAGVRDTFAWYCNAGYVEAPRERAA